MLKDRPGSNQAKYNLMHELAWNGLSQTNTADAVVQGDPSLANVEASL